MATWHPPIPAEAVYSDEVDRLGAGLRLLLYCYNSLERDGTIELSLAKASESLGKKYETVRNWWQLLKVSGIVDVIEDRGHKGMLLRMQDEWIDWHILNRNYERPQRSNLPVEDDSTVLQRSLNGSSTVRQRSNLPVEPPAYKVLHDDHESPPPPAPKNSEPPVGGGGGSKREKAPTDSQRALVRFGFSAKAACEFRDLPLAVVERELEAARISGAGPGALIERWRVDLPALPKARSPTRLPEPTRIPVPDDMLSPQEAAAAMLRFKAELDKKKREAAHAA